MSFRVHCFFSLSPLFRLKKKKRNSNITSNNGDGGVELLKTYCDLINTLKEAKILRLHNETQLSLLQPHHSLCPKLNIY